jgi:hypothetical protein
VTEVFTSATVIVPEVVIGDPVTLMFASLSIATLVTLPPPAVLAIVKAG